MGGTSQQLLEVPKREMEDRGPPDNFPHALSRSCEIASRLEEPADLAGPKPQVLSKNDGDVLKLLFQRVTWPMDKIHMANIRLAR